MVAVFRRAHKLGLAWAVVSLMVSGRAESQSRTLAKPLANGILEKAEAHLLQHHDEFVRDIVRIAEVPAPTFKEQKRARLYLTMLQAAGLSDVEADAAGNVTGLRKGDGTGPLVVVSAHLDTVFPIETDVKVRRQGTRLSAPGISDDSRGLAALLAYARAMEAAKVRTRGDILFVGTVGEEGAGNLRGVRHLLTEGRYRGRIGAFFSVDGIDPAEITNGGAGSVRYRVTFTGPGGHSFRAFGIVTPVAAMARAIDALYRLDVPSRPKTTYTIGVVTGGTSVNSIPSRAAMDVDLRSEGKSELDGLDGRFQAIVAKAVEDENRARSIAAGAVVAELELIGRRPTGLTAPDAAIVRNMVSAARAKGYRPRFETRATDANMAMSLGIPAIAIGSGGTGGRIHSLDEFIDVETAESVRGLSVGLAAIMATAGAQ